MTSRREKLRAGEERKKGGGRCTYQLLESIPSNVAVAVSDRLPEFLRLFLCWGEANRAHYEA